MGQANRLRDDILLAPYLGPSLELIDGNQLIFVDPLFLLWVEEFDNLTLLCGCMRDSSRLCENTIPKNSESINFPVFLNIGLNERNAPPGTHKRTK
jgi:hypothetical protein